MKKYSKVNKRTNLRTEGTSLHKSEKRKSGASPSIGLASPDSLVNYSMWNSNSRYIKYELPISTTLFLYPIFCNILD